MAVRTDRKVRSTLVGYSPALSGSGGNVPSRQIWAGKDPCPTDCCCHDGDLPTKGSSVLLGYKAGKAVWAGGECIYHKDGTLIPSLLVGYKGGRQVWAGSCCKPVLSGSLTGSRSGSFAGSFPGSLSGSSAGSLSGSMSGSMSGSLSGSVIRDIDCGRAYALPRTLYMTVVSSSYDGHPFVGRTSAASYGIEPSNPNGWTFRDTIDPNNAYILATDCVIVPAPGEPVPGSADTCFALRGSLALLSQDGQYLVAVGQPSHNHNRVSFSLFPFSAVIDILGGLLLRVNVHE